MLAIALLCGGAGPAQASTVVALANNGSTLIRFDTRTPGSVATVGGLCGAATRLDGLDFRPANGLLYGYSAATSGIYSVDPSTGLTTFVSTSTGPVTGTVLGIDFNPVPDRLRVATDQDENRRISVDTGAAILDGTLAYAAGDANFGVSPNIAEVAYTNSDVNPATGSTLYCIDHILNVLVSTSSPNAGVLSTVGALGFDTSELVGFDILSDGNGNNTAFATLTVGAQAGFYGINLATGAANLIGNLAATDVNGLAVLQVPEPVTAAMAAVAGLALMALMAGRRRRAVPSV